MSIAANILKVPYWLLSPLTQAKSFKENPIIGSRFLNLMGLHIFRVILAQAATRLRWILLSPMMPAKYRREFLDKGFVIIEDFISPDKIKGIREEIAQHAGPVRELTQGDTATQRFLLDSDTLQQAPHLSSIANSGKLRQYLNYTGAKIAAPLLYIQRIRNGLTATGDKKTDTDPQKHMHSDTFHPTMKAWLFLEDVTPEMGPFTYVPGSNRLTVKRLKWEYFRSIRAAKMADRYSEKGSLRASPADLEEMGLPSPHGVTAKAGSLVIANTNGFHGRGQAVAGASRLELWAFSRHNPFNPFPGISLPFAKTIKHKAMHYIWHRNDKKAEMKNSRSSWHLIPAQDMVGDIEP